MTKTNEYMRVYMAERRARRRAELVDILGGKCARCPEVFGLEFDHIDAKTKNFTIADGLDRPWAILLTEVRKCQLLCDGCHIVKTRDAGESGGGWNKNTSPQQHGSARCYQETGCRCSACRAAKSAYRMKIIRYDEIYEQHAA